MSILTPTGLETADYGTLGWNYIYSTNFEKLNDYLSKFPRLWDVNSFTSEDGDILVYSSTTNSWTDKINKNDLMDKSIYDSDADGILSVSSIPNNQINIVTSSISVSNCGIYISDATSDSITITLPSTIEDGSVFVVKK